MSMSETSKSLLSGPILDRTPSNAVEAAQMMWAEKMKARYEATTDPERMLEERDGWRFWNDEGMPYMAILVDQVSQQVWLSADTHTTISDHVDADVQLSTDLERWGSGMKYTVTESGKYGEAARAAMPNKPVAELVDPAVLLERDANALLVQVANLNREPSESQLRLFAERLADCQGRLTALSDQLSSIESTIDLAAVAVTDSLD